MSQLEKQELDDISELRKNLAIVVSEAGQTSLQIKLLESDIQELNQVLKTQSDKFKELLKQEQNLLKRLSDKYGAGQINFETGEFTPEK